MRHVRGRQGPSAELSGSLDPTQARSAAGSRREPFCPGRMSGPAWPRPPCSSRASCSSATAGPRPPGTTTWESWRTPSARTLPPCPSCSTREPSGRRLRMRRRSASSTPAGSSQSAMSTRWLGRYRRTTPAPASAPEAPAGRRGLGGWPVGPTRSTPMWPCPAGESSLTGRALLAPWQPSLPWPSPSLHQPRQGGEHRRLLAQGIHALRVPHPGPRASAPPPPSPAPVRGSQADGEARAGKGRSFLSVAVQRTWATGLAGSSDTGNAPSGLARGASPADRSRPADGIGWFAERRRPSHAPCRRCRAPQA